MIKIHKKYKDKFMPNSLTPFQQRIQNIVTDTQLNPKQKNLFLALEAEAHLP